MSKDAKPAEDAEQPPKKSKKLIIIIAAALVLLLVIAGAGVMLLKKSSHDDEEEVAEEKEPPKKEKKKKEAAAQPIFLPMEAFIVNLMPDNGEQYLQVTLSLELDDPTADGTLKPLLPKIRNNIMLHLSSKKASELISKEGKEKLAEDLRDEINSVVEPPRKNKKGEIIPPDGPVKAVLFTSFIIQ
jgi:flagellar FliL protein